MSITFDGVSCFLKKKTKTSYAHMMPRSDHEFQIYLRSMHALEATKL